MHNTVVYALYLTHLRFTVLGFHETNISFVFLMELLYVELGKNAVKFTLDKGIL